MEPIRENIIEVLLVYELVLLLHLDYQFSV